MPIDFYCMDGSPSCGSALLTAKALGIKVNLKKFDWISGDHKKPEYLKINPQHTVPAIVDDGFALAESRAIQVYFATKYGKDDSLYPNDAKKRGIVEQRLFFDIGTLDKRLWDVYGPVFEKKPPNNDKLPQVKEALEILDGYLSKTKWAAGDHITVADHSLVATISSYDVVGIDFSAYKNVTKWYKQCKEEMTGYKEAHGDGAELFREWAKQFLAGNV